MTDFELTINRVAEPGRYAVSVVRSAAGETSGAFTVDAYGWLSRLASLQQAVLASGVASRRSTPQTELPLREIGEELFTAVFTGGVLSCYQTSLALAAERDEPLRVVLRLDPPELVALPWEALFDPGLQAYVCRQEPLVRRVPVAAPPRTMTVAPPLRILAVAASPRGLIPLDTDQERRHLGQALAGPVDQGLIAVEWAEHATWAQLQNLLLAQAWHVVHFIGHGDFDPDLDEGVLALVADDGRAYRVEASQFVDLLREARPMPRLVVLNACQSATTGTDLFSGTAATLVRGGVSAVAAMQFTISDLAAIAFARGFYTALAHGRGIDEAVNSGRRAILGTSPRTLEWVTPVLYLRGDNTRLFHLTPPRPPAATSTDAPASAYPEHPLQRGEPSTTADDRQRERRGSVSTTPEPKPQVTPEKQPEKHETREKPVPDRRTPSTSSTGEPATRITHCVHILRGHTGWAWWHGGVQAVAFSPDGTLLATGSGDKTVRLWDPTTGTHHRTLAGHTNRVNAVAFSPDSALLATGSWDNTVRLWDPTTGTPHCTLAGHTESGPSGPSGVNAVAFSPDSTLLATGSDDKTVRLWDPTTGTHHRTLDHPSGVNAVAFSPDGTLLATGSDDKTVRLWDPTTGTHHRTLTGHTNKVNAVAFSPDGTLLATGSWDNTARLWDPTTGTPHRTLTGHTNKVNAVAFSPDSTLLATGSWDNTARLWDPTTGTPHRTLTGHTESGPGGPSGVNAVAFSPDSTLLATGSWDNTTRLWR